VKSRPKNDELANFALMKGLARMLKAMLMTKEWVAGVGR